MAGIFRQAASKVTTFNDISLVQTHVHVIESCMLCHCVIYKFKLSWMCLPSRRATFLLSDIKILANVRKKRQHVGNVRADVPTC